MPAINHKALDRMMTLTNTSTAHLAEEIGLSVDYVTNIRNGHRRLKRNPAMRLRIAQALDVPLKVIETEDDEPQPATVAEHFESVLGRKAAS